MRQWYATIDELLLKESTLVAELCPPRLLGLTGTLSSVGLLERLVVDFVVRHSASYHGAPRRALCLTCRHGACLSMQEGSKSRVVLVEQLGNIRWWIEHQLRLCQATWHMSQQHCFQDKLRKPVPEC